MGSQASGKVADFSNDSAQILMTEVTHDIPNSGSSEGPEPFVIVGEHFTFLRFFKGT